MSNQQSIPIFKRALVNGIPALVRRIFTVNGKVRLSVETSEDIRSLDIDDVKSIIYSSSGRKGAGADNLEET